MAEAGTVRDSQSLLEELDRLRPMAELGRLAATVAHEIRNPLAGISANVELLREALTDPADLESVDIIMGEVQRLSGLVADLLHYSRERDARTEPIDLAQISRAVLGLSRSLAEHAGVRLTCVGEGLARGDGELSRQALLNVVRNAIQACMRGGCVEVQVESGLLRVIDTGSGVPEALRERLFEPFVTGRTRGLGLGAAVAKRCLQRQGGDVELERTSSQGSVFVLRWPDAG